MRAIVRPVVMASAIWFIGFGAGTATAQVPAQRQYEGMPLATRRPSYYGYYPNGVPYQNYPYFQHRGESYLYHQPYYHARPAFGGGFYRPGTPLPPGMRPIGRGL